VLSKGKEEQERRGLAGEGWALRSENERGKQECRRRSAHSKGTGKQKVKGEGGDGWAVGTGLSKGKEEQERRGSRKGEHCTQ
jgi:hypothetical protein